MSQTYEQVETAEVVQVETVIVTERNGGASGRNGGVERAGIKEKKGKSKDKKIPINHNSKFETMNTETMNTEQEYEQVNFQDEIPTQDEISTLIKVDGWGKKKSKKRIVVVDKEEDKEEVDEDVVASEIVPQVALPLTMEESLFGTQRIDAVAEEDEFIPVMTEEECQLAQARLEWEQAGKTYKSLQDQIAKNKLKENIAEYRAERLQNVDAGIEKLEKEQEELRQQIEGMKAVRQEIVNGDFDEMILNDVFLKTEVKTEVKEPKQKVARVSRKGEFVPHTFEDRVTRVGEAEIEIFGIRFRHFGKTVDINGVKFSAVTLQELMDENANVKRLFHDVCENSERRQRKRPSEETISKFLASI